MFSTLCDHTLVDVACNTNTFILCRKTTYRPYTHTVNIQIIFRYIQYKTRDLIQFSEQTRAFYVFKN